MNNPEQGKKWQWSQLQCKNGGATQTEATRP